MERDRRSSTHSVLLTIVISLLTTLVIGSLLYYILKRIDTAHAQAMDHVVVQAGEQKARVAGQVFAGLSRKVIQADVARVQDLVDAAAEQDGLRDAMILSRDNVILAAKNQAQVGQKLQDATWFSWKGQRREVVQRAVDAAGRPVFVVVEPLADKGDIVAWAMLVFAVPQNATALRAPMDRLMETGRMMAPVLVLLLISIGLSMKLATAAIRKQIQGVMVSLLEEPTEPEGQDWLRKAG